MTEDERWCLTIECPSCHATPGEWCKTFRPQTRPAGQRAVFLHAARQRVWMAGWRSGHAAGQRMALYRAASNLKAERTAQGKYVPTPPTSPTTYGAVIEWLELLARNVD